MIPSLPLSCVPLLVRGAARFRIAFVGLSLSLFGTFSSAQLVDIATSPLIAKKNPPPNVGVSLSIEFPTIGAAFNHEPVYDPARGYLGYFDPNRCYRYQDPNSPPQPYPVDPNVDRWQSGYDGKSRPQTNLKGVFIPI